MSARAKPRAGQVAIGPNQLAKKPPRTRLWADLDDNRHLDRLPLNRPSQVRATMTDRHIWHGTFTLVARIGAPAESER